MLSRLGGVGCDVGDVQASCAGFEEHQGIVAVAECSVDVEKSAAEDAVVVTREEKLAIDLMIAR